MKSLEKKSKLEDKQLQWFWHLKTVEMARNWKILIRLTCIKQIMLEEEKEGAHRVSLHSMEAAFFFTTHCLLTWRVTSKDCQAFVLKYNQPTSFILLSASWETSSHSASHEIFLPPPRLLWNQKVHYCVH